MVNNFDKYEDHFNFRLDYISNIELTDEDIRSIKDIKTLGGDFNITKHINDYVYMFGGILLQQKY